MAQSTERLPKVVGFSEGTVLPAEGTLVVLRSCDLCGSLILQDPRDSVDRAKAHFDWHRKQQRDYPR